MAWTVWVITLWSKILSMCGDDEASSARKVLGRDNRPLHVTSEARASCEHAS